jgi:hypothetical protein
MALGEDGEETHKQAIVVCIERRYTGFWQGFFYFLLD